MADLPARPFVDRGASVGEVIMVMAVAFLQSASSVGAKVAAALALSYTTAAAMGRDSGSGAVNDWAGGVPKVRRKERNPAGAEGRGRRAPSGFQRAEAGGERPSAEVIVIDGHAVRATLALGPQL
jgi:hypothetical protein